MAFSIAPKLPSGKRLALQKFIHFDGEIEGLGIRETEYDVRTSPKLIMGGHEIAIPLSAKFREHIQNSEVMTEPDAGSVHIVDVMLLRKVVIYEVMKQKELKVMKKCSNRQNCG